MNKLDLAWGNPYFLLEILNSIYKQRLSPHDIGKMDYAPDFGVEALRVLTNQVIKETTGLGYPYIVITNGATHAINILLRLGKYMNSSLNTVYTLPFGYPYYDEMIKRAGYQRIFVDMKSDIIAKEGFCLIDSPSNPLGIQVNTGNEGRDIWDAVYHNKIYTENLDIFPKHSVMVGSYSKLLGITGARIGWIATDNWYTASLAADWATKDSATVSVPSQALIIDILENIDVDRFLTKGKNSLDLNRGEFQKIDHIFDNQPILKNGMFYCAEIDSKAFKILDKCGITYIRLENNRIRLSLGQTNKIIKESVQRILKEDKI